MPIPTKKNNCLRVGVTGGIGSGKTTVCSIFSVLGIPVYDADYWAKWLISNDVELKSGIIALLGSESYTAGGDYNRTYVANIVFNDPEKLALLNGLVHPAVEKHSTAWHLSHAAKGAPYTLKEAALLVENKSYLLLDALIVVVAPEFLRISRVMQRDGSNETDVRARLKNQLPQEEKAAVSDFTIVNDGQNLLIPQVWAIHRQLLDRTAADF